jgi:Predicted N-acetylglucosaminyl transferase
MSKLMDEFYNDLDRCYAECSLESTEQFLLDSVNSKRAEGDEESEKLIAVYNELGSLYRGTSRYSKSLEAFEKAKELAARVFGENCTEYATILNNMAGTYRLIKEYDTAAELFQKTLEIYKSEGMRNNYVYASALNNLSLVYQETKQYGKAIVYLEDALALIESMPEHRQEIAITYSNLTALYHASGDEEKAMSCLERAIREYEKCPEDERSHYAAALNSLAGYLYAEGKCERAIELYLKSAGYTKRFFGENIEYGITCQNMRWAYEKLGKHDEAIASLKKAAEIYERILGPDNDRTRNAEDDLARLEKEAG